MGKILRDETGDAKRTAVVSISGAPIVDGAAIHSSDPMATVHELKTTADADAMIQASYEAPVYLLKHSIACPISARGQMEFVGLEGEDDPDLYAVVVQYARDVSTYLADALGVKHETPQAILIKDGEAADVKSHNAIRTSDLRTAAAAS